MAAATGLNDAKEVRLAYDLLKKNSPMIYAQWYRLNCMMGLRVSDSCSITFEMVKDVDIDGYFDIIEQKTRFRKRKITNPDGSVTIEKVERNKPRRIHLSPEARGLIRRMREERPNDVYLFQSPRKDRKTGEPRPLCRTAIWKHLKAIEPMLQQARVKAGVLGRVVCGTHMVRKNFCRLLLLAGKSIEYVSSAVNHASTEMTKRYLSILENDNRETYRVFEDRYALLF